MILRVDHVSLAVTNYKKSIEFFTKILSAIPQTHGRDPKFQYYWDFILTCSFLSYLSETNKILVKRILIEEESYNINYIKKNDNNVYK